MASIYSVHNFVVTCFLFLLHSKVDASVVWKSQPSSATGIQGQSVSMTWTADLGVGETWNLVKVYQRIGASKNQMIRVEKATGRFVYSDYTSRDADLNLTASLTGTLLTTVFTLKNLNRSTDMHVYYLRIAHTSAGVDDSDDSNDLSLTVLVPPTITSPNPSTVTVTETQPAQLECTATGNPAPSFNWTRDGVIVGTGSPYTTPAVTSNDDKACYYTCVAYNGILDAKTANFCLNVQYKPKNATVLSDRSTVCQNDKVNLTCTSGPANPAPSSYEFYDNGVLVGTSASNVYEAKATAGLPSVNKFVCVPRNLLGTSLENGSVEVTAKVAPAIVTSPVSTTLAEGSSLTLFCNASGVPAPNITWTKDDGLIIGSTETFTISSVKRGDEGSYRCTASNSNECSNVTADADVVVNYPPESTNITTNNSDNTFLKGNNVRLSCASTSKPQLCNVTFYHGNTVIQSYYGKTCAGADAASHVIQSIDGCNLEEYSCKAENQYGQQEAKINLTINVPASINISPTADVVLIEGDALQLNCTATGCPTPNITWTKTGNSASLARVNGFFSSYSINSLSKSDTGHYKCSVDNEVAGSPLDRTIYVNVTYKPELTNLTSTKTEACLNDSVTLQCTTNANPPPYEYRFYLNDQLVHTSMSGVYQLNVSQAGNNTYKCEPKNTVGAGQNKSVTIATKAPPKITFSTPNKTVVERDIVVLMCNVTGSDPMKVTWSKVGGSSYPEGFSYTFTSIVRGDEATYQCTAHNGNECPAATARSSITVTYKPESTSCFTNKSSNVFLQGETVNLTCQSSAKPAQCNVFFYQGNALLANKSSATCSASHLLTNIQGCNGERLSFKVQNVAGTGKTVDINITVQVPANISVVPSTETVVLEEGQVLSLNCSATGCPTPNITWTKEGNSASLTRANGFFLSHGLNSISKAATGKYKCSVDNRVVGSPLEKTIYVNVTYKPELTNLTSTKTEACLNDSVTLQCTTNANPPAHEYRFYLNDQLVHTSMSGVYQLNVSQAGNNTYKCEPKNTVGAGQNKSVTIATKAPPQIKFSTPNKTVVERDIVVLMCNVTGSDPMNVTWSKVGGSSYPEGSSHTFTSIVRGDEATYQCTAHNGNECPAATTRSSITVTYKPENTNLTASKATACVSDELTLTCHTSGKPDPTTYRFYRNDKLIKAQSTNTYKFSTSASGNNVYKCQPENSAGNGTMANVTVIVKAAPVIEYITPSQEVVEGNTLALVCNVTDRSGQSVNVSWHKVGGGQLSSTRTHDIISVGRNDTGSYVCKAHNGNECDAKTNLTIITVKYPATIKSHSSLNVTRDENDQITLSCMVSGVPKPSINWTRNDQQIQNAHGETYAFKALESLSGNYSCIVSNGIGGRQQRTFYVKITGHCKGHGCKHGGTCRSEGQSYRCLCTRGLTGRFCDNEDPVHTEFDCLLIIVKPSWKDAYGKEDSPEHDDLEKKICSKMFKIFNGGPRRIPGKELVNCILVKARRGSIYANTLLTFNDTALKSEVLNAIQNEIVNKTIFGNLTLKASGLQVSPKSDPCSSEPCKFNSKCKVQGDNGYRCVCDAFRYGTYCEKGIGLIPGIIIIIACILIIIIMIILCVLYCKRKKSETYPSGAVENGTSMHTFNVNDHNAAATNAYETTQDEKPPYRNGQPTETYRPNEKEEVVYAALSFKASGRYPKKQEAKKLQEKTDTIYADIGSFQQSTDGKPKQDVTLAQEDRELENKVPNDANPGPKKETEGGDQNDGSNQTDNDTGGKNEVPESAQTNNNSTSPQDNLV